MEASLKEIKLPDGGGQGARSRSALVPPSARTSRLKSPSSSSSTAAVKAKAHTFQLGDKVTISGVKAGTVRYFGAVHFADGNWCGIELEDPEGKHDGFVENKRYFTCPPNHGIFAPASKVTAHSSSTKTKAKQRGIPQPRSRSRSSSPTSSEDAAVTSKQGLKRKSLMPFKSKLSSLSKPRIGKLPEKGSNDTFSKSPPKKSCGNTCSPNLNATFDKNATEAVQNATFDKDRTFDKNLTFDKNSTFDKNATFDINKTFDKKPTFDSKRPASGPNATFETQHTDNLTQDLPQNTAHGADMTEASSSQGNLNSTFNVQNPSSKANSSGAQNTPALSTTYNQLQRSKKHGRSPEPSGVSFLSESQLPDVGAPYPCQTSAEPLFDYIMAEKFSGDLSNLMTDSQISHASSLGILSDFQLEDNSLLPSANEPKRKSRRARSRLVEESGGKRNRNLAEVPNKVAALTDGFDEREIDKEISGMATPEIDMSSRSSTGKEDGCSSPEPEMLSKRSDADMTFSVNEEHASTPNTPCKPEANLNDAVRPKSHSTFLYTESPLARESRDRNANSVTQDLCREEEYPKRMRTSDEFDGNVETIPSASFELARTAVAQYADLVQGAEKERALSQCRLNNKRSERLLHEARSSSVDFGDLAKRNKRHSYHEDLPHRQSSSFTTLSILNTSLDTVALHRALYSSKTQSLCDRDRLIVHDNAIDFTSQTKHTRDITVLDNQPVTDPHKASLDGIDLAKQHDNTPHAQLASHRENILSLDEHISNEPIVVTGRDLVDITSVPPQSVVDQGTQQTENASREITNPIDSQSEKQRPFSIISSSSTDIGLGLDLMADERTERPSGERPVSMVSTASADTGIYSEPGDNTSKSAMPEERVMDSNVGTDPNLDNANALESTLIEDKMDTNDLRADGGTVPEVAETCATKEEQNLDENSKRTDMDNDRKEEKENTDMSDKSSQPPMAKEERPDVEREPGSGSSDIAMETGWAKPGEDSDPVAGDGDSETLHEMAGNDDTEDRERIQTGSDELDIEQSETSQPIEVDAVILQCIEDPKTMATEQNEKVELLGGLDAENSNVDSKPEPMENQDTPGNQCVEREAEATTVHVCEDSGPADNDLHNVDSQNENIALDAVPHQSSESGAEYQSVPPPVHEAEIEFVQDIDMLDAFQSDEKGDDECIASPDAEQPSLPQECMDVESHDVEQREDKAETGIEGNLDLVPSVAPAGESSESKDGLDLVAKQAAESADKGEEKAKKSLAKESPKKSSSAHGADRSTKLKRPSLLLRSNSTKSDSASAKSNQPRVNSSSQFKKPGNPISTKSSSSSNYVASKAPPMDSKITKRKTDTSGNPIPSKKAAGYGIHSKKSSVVKHDLNSAANSGDEGVKSGAKRSPAVKSRLLNPSARKSSMDEARPVSAPKPSMRGRLSMPAISGLRKPGSDANDAGISTKIATRSTGLRKPSAGPTSSLVKPKASSGTAQMSRSKVVTSTPKPGSQPITDAPQPDVSVLHASHDSTSSFGGHKNVSGGAIQKAGGRLAQNLQDRLRTQSIGSESQISVTSTTSTASRLSVMSSQGSMATRKRKSFAGTASSETVGSTPSARRSLLLPKSSDSSEPKKPGLSVSGTSSRLGLKTKVTSPAVIPKKPANQNKNKTVGAATSRTPTARTGKRPTLAEQHAEEIGRLEALCESRTKELNYAKMQLKQSAAGFEAMSVLVNHLTYGLDAFACPDVKRQLEETKERLENAQVQLAELMTQRDALIEEIKCMKDRQAREVERLREEHSTTLKTTEDRLTKQNEENTAKLKEEHSKEVSALKTSHEKSMEDMAQAHDTLIKKKEKEQEESLMKHKQQSQAHIEDLQHQHEHALSDITKRFENIKMTLSEKVDHLRAESEAMRRREREYLASYKADSDMKVQLAVQPFKHLPQEIESLKAVLEMRNQEIHELRRKNLEFEKQLEELPKAREKITHLEQKNENLEAVIKLKVDYERQLSEKHSVLLRRYDKEAKANKRLSMDKEELEWRLSQDSTGLAELLNRSISHSPPSSTASTPEATRRRKSPLPQQSPRSPRGGIAMEFFDNKSPRMSRSMLESPRSNGTNAHHRKQVKSADFDRPIFSTRHSSADLYTTRRDPNNVFEAEHSQDDSLMSVSTHSEPSKSNPSPVKTNLKRSGTYDLLNEEFELCEEGTCSNNLKQTDV